MRFKRAKFGQPSVGKDGPAGNPIGVRAHNGTLTMQARQKRDHGSRDGQSDTSNPPVSPMGQGATGLSR